MYEGFPEFVTVLAWIQAGSVVYANHVIMSHPVSIMVYLISEFDCGSNELVCIDCLVQFRHNSRVERPMDTQLSRLHFVVNVERSAHYP